MADITNPSLRELVSTAGDELLRSREADVGKHREILRRTRVRRLILGLSLLGSLALLRQVQRGDADFLPLPQMDPVLVTVVIFFSLLALLAIGQTVLSGRSPHVVFRPDQIDVRLNDVVGIDPVKEEVVRSLNLFLAHRTFEEGMGGRARRGLLFEGPPGTGKTHLARAMAAEAGVPFLFASGTSFQTVWQGQSAKKVRGYFKALRKAARKEGGAIGFIEEIDVIGLARSGVSTAMAPTALAGCSGSALLPALAHGAAGAGSVTNAFSGGGDTASIINELLVQMQSFDQPTGWHRLQGWVVDKVNLLLPEHRQLNRPATSSANILLIAATNRAGALDPALLRPGRFDRRLAFELPSKVGRRQLVDHFLASKAHSPDLDLEARRDAVASVTVGFSPAMMQNLFDEALVNAVRRGATQMSWEDLEHARMTTQIGIGQPTEYTAHERQLIATHEAGHATVAWLTAPHRRLEVLTIIRRQGSLGLLAHGDREDVYTRSRRELEALIQTAFGGQCAEELFFGDVSTGPGGDLLYATNTAAEMVGAHGMDTNLVSFAAVQNSAFSDTNIVGRVLADPSGRAAVQALLERQKRVTMALLASHRHLVEALRDALLDREELLGEQISAVLEQAQAQHSTQPDARRTA